MSQMQMDVINKWIDARLKDEQRRWEPWKAIAAAMTAGVIMATALLSGGFWLAQHVH